MPKSPTKTLYQAAYKREFPTFANHIHKLAFCMDQHILHQAISFGKNTQRQSEIRSAFVIAYDVLAASFYFWKSNRYNTQGGRCEVQTAPEYLYHKLRRLSETSAYDRHAPAHLVAAFLRCDRSDIAWDHW